jgi:hypothetical protein
LTEPGSKRPSAGPETAGDNRSFGVGLDVAVLLGVGVVFVIAGAWRFSKIEV